MQDNANLAVLLPVYNNQTGLLKTHAALIAAQPHMPFVIVVVDDGSSPPVDIPSGDSNTVLLRVDTNGGITRALNCGLAYILEREFTHVARIDAGDTCDPSRFVRQVERLEVGDVGLVGTNAHFVDIGGRHIFTTHYPSNARAVRRAMYLNNILLHPTIMLRTSDLRKTGLYSEHYPVAEDYELFLRLMTRVEAAILPDPLTTCVLRADGISIRRRRAQIRSRLRIQLRNFSVLRLASYLGVCRTLLALLPIKTGIERRFARVAP